MRILIVGNGGREHTLAWKLLRDAPETTLFGTQPNGGMTSIVEALAIAPGDVVALAGWAAAQNIDLVVVGPEAPLAHGLVDRLERSGIAAFGPTKAAARIESSKSYAKTLMQRAGVPTAEFAAFTDLGEATAYVREHGAPIVVKASGLAAGKGAIVCDTVEEALRALASMMADRTFGEAGREVVVEEFMRGEEMSVFALADGRDAVLMLPSQDHKRIGEGDVGPNTGGMGAYAPLSLSSDTLLTRIQDEIIKPTLAALAEDDSEFRGMLYAGIMLTEDGPRVVEFNCRFGDPETQVVLPLLESSLLDPLLEIARGGRLGATTLEWSEGAALTTVLASEGYPGSYATGHAIHIPESIIADPDVLLFHAGTTSGSNGPESSGRLENSGGPESSGRLENSGGPESSGGLETSGGRVIAATGLGATLKQAASKSLAAATAIEFSGKQFRTDIGWREFERAEPTPR